MRTELVACLVAVVACQGERADYDTVGSTGESLRAVFNTDTSKVRLVVLVAPT
jgi:hypothetical protein